MYSSYFTINISLNGFDSLLPYSASKLSSLIFLGFHSVHAPCILYDDAMRKRHVLKFTEALQHFQVFTFHEHIVQ